MKRSSTIFFQAIIVLIGAGAATFMFWEPQIEGRNLHIAPFEIYFRDPFLAYAYLASFPFFVVLYQAFKVLGLRGKNKVFAVKSLRTIKYCAIAIIGFVAIGEVFILLSESDDRTGGFFMGALVVFGSVMIGMAATMYERTLSGDFVEK